MVKKRKKLMKKRRKNTSTNISYVAEEQYLKEKEELKDALQSLKTDYENLGVGIELLAEEIYDGNCSDEKLKELISGIGTWTSNFDDLVDDLNEARVNLPIKIQRTKMINELKETEEEE